jgi:hypothetical protein
MIAAHRLALLFLFTGLSIGRFGARSTLAGDADDRIQPYPENPFYWRYQGEPVLLLGGSDDDNLFQWTGARLIEQLDLLKSVGGNYVRNTMSGRDPDTFSFLDVSQNNHQKGQTHYDNAWTRRDSIRNEPRPMTNVKIYGGDYMRFGDARDGVERFWRNIFGGHAAARFHRPPGGIGLSGRAQQMIRSARQVTDAFDLFRCEPRNDLLSQREPNEAYCLAEEARRYAVYFPAEGSVALDTSRGHTALSVRWYDVDRGRWHSAKTIQGGQFAELTTPSPGQWAVVIVAR